MTWPRVPTRRLFRVVNGGTPTSDPRNWEGHIKWATPIDLALVNGGLIEGTQRTITPIGLTSGSRSVPEKSLILSTRAPIGYIAETVTQTAFNQGCRGLVPQVKVDTRYFRYQYGVIADQLGAQGLGATFMELSSESLAASKVSAPSLSTQRAIADFLDVETAGIEALIAKKRLMLQLLIERSAGIVEWKVRELVKRHGEQRLKTAVRDVTVGIVVTPSVWYADHGVPAIRGLNVRPYKIDLSDLVKLSAEGHRIHAKSRLHAGDVVVVRTGQAGAAA
ncbi:MAG: restriction endonuclease subunit S, partial [Pseudonocardiaceae bacterium]